MARYIDVEKVKHRLFSVAVTDDTYGMAISQGIDIAVKIVNETPTADVMEVKHGEWKCEYDEELGETKVTCSVCGDSRDINGCFVSINDEALYNEDFFCPRCGAKMDRERRDT